MTWHKFSPVLLTLLVFLLAQGAGTVLLLVTGLLTLPDFSVSSDHPLFSLIIIAVNVLAVLCCRFLLHSIRFVTAGDVASVRWRPGLLAIAGGLLGAVSISILTESVELPQSVLQTSLAMSHNAYGLIALILIGPITEELLFREAIEGEMLRRGANPWTAVFVSALAFSAVHLNLAQGLYALPLAILFGIIYYRTGNIVLTSLLHILNNGIVVIQLYAYGEDITGMSYSDWLGGTVQAYFAMLFLGLSCVVLTRLFWDKYPPVQEKQKNSQS